MTVTVTAHDVWSVGKYVLVGLGGFAVGVGIVLALFVRAWRESTWW